MSRQKNSSEQHTFRDRPKPFTQVMLEEVDGGQEGLLPLSVQGKPLKIEFERWTNTDPSPEYPETVELFWNGSTLEKTWTAPIAEDDHFIEVPADWLFDGVHHVHYLLTLHTGQTEPSAVRVLTVDTEPAELDAESKLQFDTDTIDQKYLDEHENVVRVEVPLHSPRTVGDVVVATWENPLNGAIEEYRTEPLTKYNYQYPIYLEFDKDLILKSGDGKRQVSYRVEDRAGTVSAESVPAELLVAVIRAPRYLPNPWVIEIGGLPSDWGSLKPENTLRGATVSIPEEAIYYDDDRLEVQFGEPGVIGSITVPVVAGAREVSIPKESIAAYLNSSLSVTYLVHLQDGTTEPSRPLTLAIDAYPASRLPGAQLVAPHSDPVYKSLITAGLPLFQRKWAYISTQCLITITVTGTGTDGQPKSATIVNAQPVTNAQVTEGVLATVPLAFMYSLKDDARFRVQTQVSFNNGRSWFPFTLLNPMLRP
ncbi:hypothetical protein [Pseudomonas sp. NFX98]|uniref:hypothetical protein n=1 Tax=Pseudomonas sp. NFX98 TaxID=3399122 RepID=UPI0039FBBC5E